MDADFFVRFAIGFAGGVGGGGGFIFTFLSCTITGGASYTFSTCGGFGGGGGSGIAFFFACVTITTHTRQTGNNNIFFINSFLFRYRKAIIPQSFYH